MSNNFFDDSVRDKLYGHESPVPADAWANIQKGKRKRRPWIFFWILAGLLLCGGGVYLIHSGKRTNQVIASSPQQTANKVVVLSSQNNNSLNRDTIFTTSKEYNNALTKLPVTPATENPTSRTASRRTNDHTSKNSTTGINKVGLITSNAAVDSPPKLLGQQKKTHGKKDWIAAPANKAGSINNTYEAGEMNSNFNKPEHVVAGKVSIQVSSPNSSTGETMEENIKSEESDTGTNLAMKNEHADDLVTGERKKDSPAIVIKTSGSKPVGKKKKNTGLDIDLSISGFIPAAEKKVISIVNRTTIDPMHRAEFTANKVQLRLQPGVSFNLIVFKSLSSRFAAGTGLSYQAIKEYIHLYGEEVNTNYRIIKRLDGNVLVDDTVSTTTTGMRSIDAVNSYTFLSIPVSFRYRILNRSQWSMDMQAGIDINIQSRYKNSIGGYLEPQFAGGASDTKRNGSIGTGFNAGIRLSRRVGKNYLLYTAPYLQLNPTTLYLPEMLAPQKMHRAGLSFGLSYNL